MMTNHISTYIERSKSPSLCKKKEKKKNGSKVIMAPKLWNSVENQSMTYAIRFVNIILQRANRQEHCN